MALMSAFSSSSQDAGKPIFDSIEAQFRLDDEKLREIVSQFLEDFRSGLHEYGHPMAMMYVTYTFSPSKLMNALKSFVCHGCA